MDMDISSSFIYSMRRMGCTQLTLKLQGKRLLLLLLLFEPLSSHREAGSMYKVLHKHQRKVLYVCIRAYCTIKKMKNDTVADIHILDPHSSACSGCATLFLHFPSIHKIYI